LKTFPRPCILCPKPHQLKVLWNTHMNAHLKSHFCLPRGYVPAASFFCVGVLWVFMNWIRICVLVICLLSASCFSLVRAGRSLREPRMQGARDSYLNLMPSFTVTGLHDPQWFASSYMVKVEPTFSKGSVHLYIRRSVLIISNTPFIS
jgi:hypothetical protein